MEAVAFVLCETSRFSHEPRLGSMFASQGFCGQLGPFLEDALERAGAITGYVSVTAAAAVF